MSDDGEKTSDRDSGAEVDEQEAAPSSQRKKKGLKTKKGQLLVRSSNKAPVTKPKEPKKKQEKEEVRKNESNQKKEKETEAKKPKQKEVEAKESKKEEEKASECMEVDGENSENKDRLHFSYLRLGAKSQ